MHEILPRLKNTDFPSLRRASLETLQVNLGYRCNLSCTHCHVSASPRRTEEMDRETAELVIRFLHASRVSTLDLTGGAPEMNPNFRHLVHEARTSGVHVIDRCNLTILNEPEHHDLAYFLADQGVHVVASLPCYLEDNIDYQRGKGVYDASIKALKNLNKLGYGKPDSGLELDLIFNPQGPALPPPQDTLERDYKRELANRFGIMFNRLLTLANMPVGRFGSLLVSKGQFAPYMALLKEAYQSANLESVMCRTLVSIDWRGYAYDCDFNQMLGLPLRLNGARSTHLSEMMDFDLEGRPILVGEHCYGCTAGQGSSCGGALK